MTITVSTGDARSVKALALLETAGTWRRGHRKDDGRPFFVVPGSQGRLYWTDTRACTCPDFANRQQACKHVLAVRLWVARQGAPAPAPARRISDAFAPCSAGCGTLADGLERALNRGHCHGCEADVLTKSAEYAALFGQEG